jgi:sphingomyelin phosphodiesterase acid-like 3
MTADRLSPCDRNALTIGMGLLLFWLLAAATPKAQAAPWLFVSDIHFDPTNHRRLPVGYGRDTNLALLDSALLEMKRVDPDPPVVMITGDFLAHGFDYAGAEATMAEIARKFDRTFPHAQFVIALGNEDSGCADYGLALDAPFLRATARAWAPLVDRNGAAPSFTATFPRDGFYIARLPLRRTIAVVVDDVFWSPRSFPGCGGKPGGDAQTAIDLTRALHRTPNDRHWIVGHIPPGIDAYSTAHLARRLLVVSFFDPRWRDRLLSLIADPQTRVSLVIMAHTHKFAYRIVGRPEDPIPLLTIPSISPIFGNAPSFLTVDVDASGTIRSAENRAYLDGRWTDVGGTRSLGLSAFTGPELVRLHRRLANDAELRKTFARLYESGAPPEIDDANWPTYWCAASTFGSTAFRRCAALGGFSVFTRRAIILAVTTAVVLPTAAGLVGWFVLRRRRRLRTP